MPHMTVKCNDLFI